MKLLLRRGERKSAFGKLVFVLEVRAEISPEENSWIDKYKLGATLLYSKKGRPNADPTTLLGVGAILLHHALDITIYVDNLRHGKAVECKDIIEMLIAEEAIKDAAKTFAGVLHAASKFGGEEVIEL
ncbi:MAG TPA: hypothetical protein VII56_08185 [Rhizomicrobium sp.]